MTQGIAAGQDLVAELNDLLKLDHDAVGAYTIAIERVQNPAYRATLEQFRSDHERHIQELSAIVRAHGSMPIDAPHISSADFKLAVQGVGALGGDRALLLAFKANERQVRDKYRRAAEGTLPPDASVVVSRAANDEARHYAWVLEALDDLGVDQDSTAARVEEALEKAQSRMADALEGAERIASSAARRASRAMEKKQTRVVVGAAVLLVGTGLVAAKLLRGRDRW